MWSACRSRPSCFTQLLGRRPRRPACLPDRGRGVVRQPRSIPEDRCRPIARLSWKWRVELPLLTADLREKQGDDNAVKVCVFFDEPIEKAAFAERQLLRYARGRTTDPVPVATVCYVWDAKLAQGTTLDNAFTRRQRYMVLESGTVRLNQWVPERRDLGADFLRLFGDEMDSVPAITGIAVGADADNTKSHSISYVGNLVLEP